MILPCHSGHEINILDETTSKCNLQKFPKTGNLLLYLQTKIQSKFLHRWLVIPHCHQPYWYYGIRLDSPIGPHPRRGNKDETRRPRFILPARHRPDLHDWCEKYLKHLQSPHGRTRERSDGIYLASRLADSKIKTTVCGELQSGVENDQVKIEALWKEAHGLKTGEQLMARGGADHTQISSFNAIGNLEQRGRRDRRDYMR